MKKLYYFIALLFLTLGIVIWSTTADAGGPWNNQYCDIEVTKVRVVDQQGNTVKLSLIHI